MCVRYQCREIRDIGQEAAWRTAAVVGTLAAGQRTGATHKELNQRARDGEPPTTVAINVRDDVHEGADGDTSK